MSSSTARSLDTAVCTCGHYFDDHRYNGFDPNTGRIFLGECLDTTCPCTNYAGAGARPRLIGAPA